MGFSNEEKHKDAVDVSNDVNFVLCQLASANKCSFLSDLPLLFRRGAMKRGEVSVRGFGLPVWSQVLTYLSGEPQWFESHDEVDRRLDA